MALNKGVAWLYNEVCALLDIWADQEIQQQLAGRLHNMSIYEKISKRLADLGIVRTGEQCREKIKKIRRDYKTVVDNNYSPAFARKLLGCYDKVNEIFGKRTVIKPSFVIESLVFNENLRNEGKLPALETDNVHKSVAQCDLQQQQNDSKCSNELISNSICEKMNDRPLAYNCEKKRLKNRLERQTALYQKIQKRQTVLQNRYLSIEKERYENEFQREQEKLLALEVQRKKARMQELILFKSVLNTFAERNDLNVSLD